RYRAGSPPGPPRRWPARQTIREAGSGSLRIPDHSLHEPVHGQDVVQGQLLPVGDVHRAALVLDRSGELVEAAALERRLLLVDGVTRALRDGGAEGRDVDEVVLHA